MNPKQLNFIIFYLIHAYCTHTHTNTTTSMRQEIVRVQPTLFIHLTGTVEFTSIVTDVTSKRSDCGLNKEY